MHIKTKMGFMAFVELKLLSFIAQLSLFLRQTLVSFGQKGNSRISFVSADILFWSFYIVGARVPLQAEMRGRG